MGISDYTVTYVVIPVIFTFVFLFIHIFVCLQLKPAIMNSVLTSCYVLFSELQRYIRAVIIIIV